MFFDGFGVYGFGVCLLVLTCCFYFDIGFGMLFGDCFVALYIDGLAVGSYLDYFFGLRLISLLF